MEWQKMNNNDSIRISVGGDTVFVNKDDFKVGNRESKNKQRRRKRGPRNPQPKEWLASNLSQMKIADYKPFNFVDGEGIRCSLYVSGFAASAMQSGRNEADVLLFRNRGCPDIRDRALGQLRFRAKNAAWQPGPACKEQRRAVLPFHGRCRLPAGRRRPRSRPGRP